MSFSRAKATINSRVALMSAILEHSGHLTEYLSDYEGIDFSKCCRYILYTFSENTRPDIVGIIGNSSNIHMNNLTNNKPPSITNSRWTYGLNPDDIVKEINDVDSSWCDWTPSHDIGEMMKSSFDEIL